jgi:hypothetical protein
MNTAFLTIAALALNISTCQAQTCFEQDDKEIDMSLFVYNGKLDNDKIDLTLNIGGGITGGKSTRNLDTEDIVSLVNSIDVKDGKRFQLVLIVKDSGKISAKALFDAMVKFSDGIKSSKKTNIYVNIIAK